MPKKTKFYACDNGCKLFPDCFTCTLTDCYKDGKPRGKDGLTASQRYYRNNSEKVKAKSREYKARKRQEALQKEFPHLDFGGAK